MSNSSSFTVLLLHHHQLLFLHVRQSTELVIDRLSQVLVGSVLAAESRRRAGSWRLCDLLTETTDVKPGHRLLRSNAVERRSDVIRPRVRDAADLLLRVSARVW